MNAGVAHVTPARYIVWVVLRHKATGLLLVRLNTHVVHHIEVAGRPRKDTFPGQLDRAKHHFAQLALKTVELSKIAPLIGGGDLNVDYLAEKKLAKPTVWFPLTVLGKVAELDMTTGPSHDTRYIDWTWHVGDLELLEQKLLKLGFSDHHGVLSTFTLTGVPA